MTYTENDINPGDEIVGRIYRYFITKVEDRRVYYKSIGSSHELSMYTSQCIKFLNNGALKIITHQINEMYEIF